MEPRQPEFKTSPGSVCNFVCFFVGSILQTNRAFKKPLFLSSSTYIKKIISLSDVTKTGNGERGAGSGERGAGSGERGTEVLAIFYW